MIALWGITGMLLTGCKRTSNMSGIPPATQPGERRVFAIGHGVNLGFRWAPAGEFVTDDSMPGIGGSITANVIKLREGFWISEDEISVTAWVKVMGCEPSGASKRVENKVACVSWNESRDFLKRLTSPDVGLKYELPTAAQWEYACRAGANTADARRPAKLAWINASPTSRNHPVGMKPSNAWSIRDMNGNVGEWCLDAVDQGGAAAAGGSASAVKGMSRCGSARDPDPSFLRFNRVSFRLVLVSGPTPAEVPMPAKLSGGSAWIAGPVRKN